MDIDNKYGTLDLQKKLLVLLKEFHRFCIENNVKYSLDWGSLLGAIRHKGFIPWDDDLDIMVDRENYCKLRELIEKDSKFSYEYGTPKCLWIDHVRLTADVDLSPKPTMDVFIIDNAPDGLFARKVRLALILFLQGMMKRNPDFKKGNILYRAATLLTYTLGRLFSLKKLMSWFSFISQLSNKRPTKMKASYNTLFEDVAKLRHNSILTDFVLVPFEDTEVFVTKDYHQALIDMFGPDYMTPVYREPWYINNSKND